MFLLSSNKPFSVFLHSIIVSPTIQDRVEIREILKQIIWWSFEVQQANEWIYLESRVVEPRNTIQMRYYAIEKFFLSHFHFHPRLHIRYRDFDMWNENEMCNNIKQITKMFVYSETCDDHQQRRLFFPHVNFARSRTIFLLSLSVRNFWEGKMKLKRKKKKSKIICIDQAKHTNIHRLQFWISNNFFSNKLHILICTCSKYLISIRNLNFYEICIFSKFLNLFSSPRDFFAIVNYAMVSISSGISCRRFFFASIELNEIESFR